MTDYWQHNLELLQIHLPVIHAWAVQRPDRPATPDEPAYDGDTEKWFDDLTASEWYIGLLLGFGDGAHVERLIRTYPDRALYVLEPDPDAFLRACHDRDLAPIVTHSDFQLLLIHQLDVRLIAQRLFQSVREHLALGKIVTLNWPPYKARWGDFWLQFHDRITEHIKQDATNMATYRRYTLDWQRNVWANLPYAVRDPGVGALFDRFAGKPAILVASGPSLAKNIHLLPQARGRALIVAAGSGIEPLRKAGIQPDLALSFDAGEQNIQPFLGLDAEMPTLPLVYSGVIYPQVVATWAGPRWVMGVDVYPFETWIYRQLGQNKGEVSSGPSVANVTWDLLMRLGCNPIILVGQDLALTGGRTHADGVASAAAVDLDNLGVGYELVDGIDGEKVWTTTVMLTFKTWFEQRIILWRNLQTQAGAPVQITIDATEGGARIEGTELLSLREAIDTYCTAAFDPSGLLSRLHAEGTAAAVRPADVAAVKDRLHSQLDFLRSLMTAGDHAVSELRTLSANGVTGDKILPLALDLARLDRRLTQHDIHRQFLEPAMRQYLHLYTIRSNGLRDMADPSDAAWGLAELYGAYLDDTRVMMAQIERMF